MSDKELRELQNIRNLLNLKFAKSGSSSDEIAQELGVNPSRVRQIISLKKVKKFPFVD